MTSYEYLIDPSDPRIAAVELASIEFSWKRPDSIIISEPGWFQVSTPSSKEFYLNEVAFCSLEELPAAARIKSTIQEFRRRQVHFRWITGPSSRPRSIESILLAEGLKHTFDCLGMVRSTQLDTIKHVDPSITVEKVDLRNVGDYARACVQGWGNPSEMAGAIQEDMERSIATDEGKIEYFLARRGGRPAGTGVLCISNSSGYLKGTSVVPSERKHGVYRALLQHRIKILNQLGIPMATVQAIADTSAPLCRRFGFEEVCRMRQFQGS